MEHDEHQKAANTSYTSTLLHKRGFSTSEVTLDSSALAAIAWSLSTITTDAPVGPDVDLDREVVRQADGTRLTPTVAKAIVEGARRGGRPSLSGRAAHSPQIAFRVPAEVRDPAAQVAADEGKTVSQLAREALEARLGVRS